MTNNISNRIRLYATYNLIFFMSYIFFKCISEKGAEKIKIHWKDQRAVAISIPRDLVEKLDLDRIVTQISVHLVSNDKPISILGELKVEEENLIFTPLIPFTRGLRYEVMSGNQRISSFEIPHLASDDHPKLLAIYPSSDTLPENLLKIYLHFSRPMREGQSAKYVFLVKNDVDTVKGAFLDLQPELWNVDRTTLTLWLDPGRIKRDLKPNKLFGAPLQRNEAYQIQISENWQDTQGAKLPKSYHKSFVTTQRDSLSPVPQRWKLNVPKSGTKEPLRIEFFEVLDWSLLQDVFTVKSSTGGIISGKWKIENKERQCQFVPDGNWIAGNYTLQVETKLEDLAGNNINRPFDRDVTATATVVRSEAYVKIPFTVAN